MDTVVAPHKRAPSPTLLLSIGAYRVRRKENEDMLEGQEQSIGGISVARPFDQCQVCDHLFPGVL